MYTKICQYTSARAEETKATGQLVCVITGDCRAVEKYGREENKDGQFIGRRMEDYEPALGA